MKKNNVFYNLFSWLKKSYKRFKLLTKDYDISIFSAAIVFYILSVFVPLLMLLSEVFRMLYQFNIGFFEENLNETTASIINTILLTKTPMQMKGFAGALFLFNMIWISSKLMNALNRISDLVYVEVKNRNTLKLRIRSFVMMLFAVFLLFFDVVLMISLNYLIGIFYKETLPPIFIFRFLFTDVIPFLINLFGIAVFVLLLYKYIIPIKITFRKVLFSSFLVTVIWYLLTIILRYYFSINKNNSIIYGTFSSIFAILIWLYFLSYVFILGLVYNYYQYLEHGKKRKA